MDDKSGRVTSFIPFLEGVRAQRGERSAGRPSLVERTSVLGGVVGPRRRDVGPGAVRIVRVLEQGPRPVTELASEAGLATPDFMQAFQELLEAEAIRLKGVPGREDAELTDSRLFEPSHS